MRLGHLEALDILYLGPFVYGMFCIWMFYLGTFYSCTFCTVKLVPSLFSTEVEFTNLFSTKTQDDLESRFLQFTIHNHDSAKSTTQKHDPDADF